MISESPNPITSHDIDQTPDKVTTSTHHSTGRKSFAFWMTFLSLCLSLSLFALELTSVSTALPTIVEALHVSEFVWVGASYALASMACVPLTGNTAQVFGRKPTLVAAVLIFAVGSALCGAAQNAAMLLAGRTIQGFGGGSIIALSNILLGDLVPLRERGTYFGFLGLYVADYILDLNLPISGLCLLVFVLFLRLRTPTEGFVEKIKKLDYM
ncbi:hypothetical protein Clacol_005072 [Clathrus columnatus]|uniref:Major facilitator superfamily (MFS) profile domain-containing protein n=1 Tax=Clathrus columnatus TaxID=1419009 RepID=A0AAV5A899_9AGAM|nr:hypothetical protein Clacol_005072 [Clathrus columnatus]